MCANLHATTHLLITSIFEKNLILLLRQNCFAKVSD